MKLVTSQQMRDLEQRANAAGNTYAQMMERAGTLTAQAITKRLYLKEANILVLVGPGNNGGDGLVAARVLSDAGNRVHLYLWKRTPDEKDTNWQQTQERSIPFTLAPEDTDFAILCEQVKTAKVIIDALLGTGVSRPIEGNLQALLETVTATLQANKPKRDLNPPNSHHLLRDFSGEHRLNVAVDLPSGLNPDTGALDPATLPADLTVTFAFPKIGQYTFPGADAVGQLLVADIGITDDGDNALQLATAQQVASRLPKRERDSNKGSFGKVMLACGSPNYTGAPVLAAHAAGRVGAGLVTIAIPQTLHPIIAAKIDEATFLPLPDRLGDWRPRSATELLAYLWDTKYESLLVGCGLGRSQSTGEFIERLLEGLPKLENPPALVLDADALNHLAEIPDWWARFAFATPPILTPHPGEMARLLDLKTSKVQKNRIEVARDAAEQWNAIVVLKGAFTVVAAPEGAVTLIPFANSALATAGTGDVLAGTIAGLAAQYFAKRDENFDPYARAYDAAVVGAYVHALAGEDAASEIGQVGLVAGDLLTHLPSAITHLVHLFNA